MAVEVEEGLRVAKEEDVSATAAAVVGSSAPILECGFGIWAPPILSVLRPLLVASVCLSSFFLYSRRSDKWDSCETASFSSCLLYSLSLLLAHTLSLCVPLFVPVQLLSHGASLSDRRLRIRGQGQGAEEEGGQTGLATPLPQMIGFGAATTIHVLVHVQRSPYAIMQCSFSLKMVAVEEGGSFFVASSLSGEAVFHFHLITFL